MNGKTPTQRDLAAAEQGRGFSRSTTYATRGLRGHTAGYVVTGRGSEVLVQHQVISYVPLASDRPQIDRMLAAYQEVIDAAGYAVSRDGDVLVVAARNENREKESLWDRTLTPCSPGESTSATRTTL